jgi:alcohol dehydrogenase class IV
MQFEFATAARILFAPGSAEQIPRIAREFGTQALIVTGRDANRCADVCAGLAREGVAHSVFSVAGEPSLDAVRNGAQALRNRRADVVIGFGGGSAIDAAKAIAALAPNSGEPLDYLEVIGRAAALDRGPLPVIAVPTTAGTGSEVTRNAVLYSPEHGVKASLRSPLMLPRVAVVDPNLTLPLPPAVTASTGLDALTQLIEPYVSVRANAMTDLFCREGMGRAAGALVAAFENGSDRNAREAMSFASLLGGLSLANAGLGAVHGFAAPVGGMFDAPHGAICAALLPLGMEINIRALRAGTAGGDALRRYADVAGILTGDPEAEPEKGIAWVRELCGRLAIPPLRTYGVTQDSVPQLVEKAANASSMKGNPVVLSPDLLTEMISRAI